jgi:hypothetical protein
MDSWFEPRPFTIDKVTRVRGRDTSTLSVNQLFRDDTIDVLLQKLSGRLSAPASEIYVWGRKSGSGDAESVTFDIMRGRPVVLREEVDSAIASGSIKALSLMSRRKGEVLRTADVLSAVREALRHGPERLYPMSVQMYEQAFQVYFPANPFGISDKNNIVRAPWLQHDSLPAGSRTTIEGNGDVEELFATTLADVRAHLGSLRLPGSTVQRIESIYFPEHRLQSDAKSKLSEEDNQMVMEAIAKHGGSKEDVKERCIVRSLRLHHNQVNVNPPFNLVDVFSRIHTSATVPYACLVDPMNTLHKIHHPKFSLERRQGGGRTLSMDQLKRWMDRNAKRTAKEALLRVHVDASDAVEIMVEIDECLRVKVWYAFEISASASRTFEQSLEAVNDALALVKDATNSKGAHLPPIERADLVGGDLLAWINVTTLFVVRKSTPSLSRLTEVFRWMSPLFAVLPSEEKDAVLLQYKRHDSFEEEDLVNHFMTMNYLLEEGEMVPELVREFSMTEDEAKDAYAAWSANRRMDLVRGFGGTGAMFRPTSEHAIHVRVALTNVGAQASIIGAYRREHVWRVNAALAYALRVATSNRKTTSSSSKNQDPFEPKRNDVFLRDLQGLGIEGVYVNRDHLRETIEVDDELLAELQADILSAPLDTQGQDQDQDSAAARQNQLTDMYLVDPKRFPKGLYSTICSKNRQPIVMTPEERNKMDARAPKSYGSTAIKVGDNLYACPQVWCPKSRVAMTMEEYLANGSSCPFPDDVQEEAVIRKGAHDYVGVHDPSAHPEGLCMPCCFKKPGRGFKWLNDSNAARTTTEEADGEEYIRSVGFPGPEARFTLMPPQLQALFDNRSCGARPDGSGVITPKSQCFVRRGMAPSSQPFLACAAFLLGFEDAAHLCKHLADQLDMTTFLSLNAGRTFRAFAGLAARDSQRKSRKGNNEDDALEQVYNDALAAYKAYLLDDGILKTPTHVIDHLNKSHRSRFVIFRLDEDEGVTLPCSQALSLDPLMQVFAVVQHKSWFEPVVQVTLQQDQSSSSKARLPRVRVQRSLRLPPRTLAMMMVHQRTCMESRGSTFVARDQLLAALRLLGATPTGQVIDAHCRLRGIQVEPSGIVVPLPPQGFDPSMRPILRLSEVLGQKVKRHASIDAAAKLLNGLQGVLGDFYACTRREGALVMADGTPIIVPGLMMTTSMSPEVRKLAHGVLLDERIITWPVASSRGGPHVDPSQAWVRQHEAEEAKYNALRTAVEAALQASPEAMDDLYYMKHPLNPLPLETRYARFLEMVRARAKQLTLSQPARLARQAITGWTDATEIVAPAGSDEVVLMQHEVSNRTVRQLARMLRAKDLIGESSTDVDRVTKEVGATTWQSIFLFGKQFMDAYDLQADGRLATESGTFRVYQIHPPGSKGCKKPVLHILASAINQTSPELRASVESLEKVLEVYVRHAFVSGASKSVLEGLRSNPAFVRASGSKKDVDGIVGILRSPCYAVGPHECRVIGEVMGLNVVFVTTKLQLLMPPRMDDGQHCMVLRVDSSRATIDGLVTPENDRVLMPSSALLALSPRSPGGPSRRTVG